MKVESIEGYKAKECQYHFSIKQSENRVASADKKWEYLSEQEKSGEKGKALLQEKGEAMTQMAKDRKELSELEISKD